LTVNPEIQAALKSIAKQYGEGSAMILGEAQDMDIERFPSGSLNLDLVLGGGWPRGRVVELYGPQSGGKTTVALLAIAQAQKAFPDRYALFIDLEHSLDVKLAKEYGVDEQRLVISQPDTGEQAFNIAEALIRSGTISVVVLDSVSALLPEAEAKGEMQDQQIGLQARLMSKALRKLTPPANEFETTIFFINQIREKVGVMYGNPETTSGGRSLAFYSSVRVNIRPGERIPDPHKKDEVMGHIVNVNIVKNKTARPFKKGSFELIYGIGVDAVSEIADIALLGDFVQRAGAYYQIRENPRDKDTVITRHFNGEEVKLSFQGKDAFVSHLKEDTGLYEILDRAVRTGEAPSVEEIIGEA
jgi:recombination protein RecA